MKKHQEIIAIPNRDDNYIWALVDRESNCCCIIDPGNSEPVIDFLTAHSLSLNTILITHKHHDHTHGVNGLLKAYPEAELYIPLAEIYTTRQVVTEASMVNLNEFGCWKVIELPGHTLEHIAYFNGEHLFCGDTLFSAGCGRVFEGTYEQMYGSLLKLKNLPDETLIYPAHEYTLQNLSFAQVVEPENEAIQQHIQYVTSLREKGLPSLPTTLQQEKLINPFLRCDQINSKKMISQQRNYIECELDLFTALRKWKG